MCSRLYLHQTPDQHFNALLLQHDGSTNLFDLNFYPYCAQPSSPRALLTRLSAPKQLGTHNHILCNVHNDNMLCTATGSRISTMTGVQPELTQTFPRLPLCTHHNLTRTASLVSNVLGHFPIPVQHELNTPMASNCTIILASLLCCWCAYNCCNCCSITLSTAKVHSHWPVAATIMSTTYCTGH
jgi:hypothetical protein